MRRHLLRSAACALLIAGGASGAQAAKTCATRASDTADVTKVVNGFFEAIHRGDVAAAAALTTPSFHAYDVEKHFTGKELFSMIGGAMQKGAKISFGMSPIEVHVDCNFAWAVWKNDGQINATPVSWLESGMLRRTPAGWRWDFYHSTKLSPPKP